MNKNRGADFRDEMEMRRFKMHSNPRETDEQLLMRAYVLAREMSHDPSTQNGALLVDSTGKIVASGANTFPAGVAMSDERWTRPLKYEFVEHAERNAIYDAARMGVRTKGLLMYCAWAACPDCARAIIQAGISVLVTHRPQSGDNGTWGDGIARADAMMREAGVILRFIDKKLTRDGDVFSVRRNGQLMTP